MPSREELEAELRSGPRDHHYWDGLAERFRHFLGVPPMAYLTSWRLQLGAQLLKSTSRGVAQIAGEVGYESEPAFNRAFKREFDAPPARYRLKAKVAAAK